MQSRTDIRVSVVRVQKGLMVPLWSGCVSFALLLSPLASASTVTVFDPGSRRGDPIAQSFLEDQSENVSLVRTETGISCVASGVLPIAAASYSAPDGTPVSFDDVIRSPASSIQAIARPGEPTAFRFQLKYSPDPSRPVEMRIAGQTFELGDALEPSGDSLLLTGKKAQVLADALRRGAATTLSATSDATGRQVGDRIVAPDMDGLDSCLVTLENLPAVAEMSRADDATRDVARADMPRSGSEMQQSGDRVADTSQRNAQEDTDIRAADTTDTSRPLVPVPVTGFRLEFTARPDPDRRVDPNALQHCRMRDIPDEVFLGRLKAVTGFFSQTQDVYVAFDDRGELQRAYIPGIFDSDLTTGSNHARVSLAADSNLPDQPNTVSGCLGDAPLEAPVCTISESEHGNYTVAECGVLGMSQSRDAYLDDPLVPVFTALDETMPTTMTTTSSEPNGRSFSRSIGGSQNLSGFDGFIGGGGGGGRRTRSDDAFDILAPGGGSAFTGESGKAVSIVPLPTAFSMMLLALTGLSGFGMLVQRQRTVRPIERAALQIRRSGQAARLFARDVWNFFTRVRA